MQVINFSEQNSIINQFMSELRDKSYQKNRYLFRHNIERIGELMAYEVSKTLDYKPKTITTPLGTIDIPLVKDQPILLLPSCTSVTLFHTAVLRTRSPASP